ncbi:hypothetical protein KOR42_35860 [Thalassoglobus neptunius]|uniref:Uncharacterized protein n=1 Tax=Thalassoglobus neptunius TaxID=1938619 RepID=A0A5C5WLI9_9PLAN|nr:hypothetical protein [Thalassoglobus neptunius]TWT51538.1 hypothetical protein KOR42_35860 [Thalassoglobus neptunius]
MPRSEVNDSELLAYLDEMLPVERATQIEAVLRESPALRKRAALLSRRRDHGAHTVGEIWRRRQLSCPSRETLGSMLLGVAEPDVEDYIQFHIQVVGCRVCLANLLDLKEKQSQDADDSSRPQRYFESSAGLFRSQYRQD